ncbi:aspartic peptidase domain-containing protein [Cladorrhinum sp. PSN332]|nr:aspartic peptidase domain-containing protein [Cladorrhinum sp. PSN332]
MRLPRLRIAVVCDILLLLSESRLVVATPAPASPTSTAAPEKPTAPLWIQPSGEWFDSFDGKWSNFMFVVGFSPVYLTPATALSEIWAVSTGGCTPTQLCFDARGGVVDIKSSETWRPLGPWELGMNQTGYGGNGDYGLETVAFVNTLTSYTSAIEDVLVAAINDTNHYQGYIGLGVTQARFNKGNLTNPFISQLAQIEGKIPSHSYGYTAGAYYRPNGRSDGTIASLTLGGYDKMRFSPHSTNFPLDPVTRFPTVRLRGVTAQVSSLDKAPAANWTSTSRTLVTMDDSITAIIDSSTPYLWLPTEICDRFAAALNLTWRDDLGVYVFQDGPQYTRFVNGNSLSFTFTLSGFDNTDNFGQPLNVPGVVNITAPSAAFAHVLRYPFRGVIQYGESGIPYFPLKRSTKQSNNNTLIIGRAFMQEAYIITRYDRSIFSVHQALFPDNAASNHSLEGIERPPNSPYPEFQGMPAKTPHEGLTQGQTAGIALGAFIIASIVGFTTWCCCRRRRRKKQVKQEGKMEESKNIALHIEEEDEPRSPVKRMFTKIIRKKRSKKTNVHEADGTSRSPVEVGADEHHQVFEMPVPIEPVELDSHDLGDEDTDIGVDSLQGLSEYELTRRKLERQMLGPVPTYSPTDTMSQTTRQEKSMHDVASVAHYRPTDEPSPVSTPTYANTNSLPDCLPSPMSPHPDWAGRMFDLPSPMTVVSPSHLHQAPTTGSDPSCSYSPVSPHSSNSPHNFVPSSVSHSDSNSVSPTSLTGSVRFPPPTFQRTPIDDSRVVCLGPLPEGVELPHQRPPIPRILGPDGRAVQQGGPVSPHTPASPLPPPGPLGHYRSDTNGSSDTLGSNFTEEEGQLVAEVVQRTYQGSGLRLEQTHQQQQPQLNVQEPSPPSPQSPQSMERIESSLEFIHVPQVADKRYSWEEPEGNPRQD